MYQNKIIDCIYQVKGIRLIKDTELITGGRINSIELIELIALLEKTFSLKLPLEELCLENFESVETIDMLIKKYTVDITKI